MKKLIKMHPKVETNAEGTHSHYVYPNEFIGNLKTQVITYNRNLEDFLTEQMWMVEGSTKQIARLLTCPDVTSILNWEAAEVLAEKWNVSRKVITNHDAVIEAVDEIVNSGVIVPEALDPNASAPGIITKTFKLSDHVQEGELDE